MKKIRVHLSEEYQKGVTWMPHDEDKEEIYGLAVEGVNNAILQKLGGYFDTSTFEGYDFIYSTEHDGCAEWLRTAIETVGRYELIDFLDSKFFTTNEKMLFERAVEQGWLTAEIIAE